MFEEMIGDIREGTVRFCFNVTVDTSSERKKVIAGGEGRKEDYQEEAARPTVRRGPVGWRRRRTDAAGSTEAGGRAQAGNVPSRDAEGR